MNGVINIKTRNLNAANITTGSNNMILKIIQFKEKIRYFNMEWILIFLNLAELTLMVHQEIEIDMKTTV